MQWGQIKTLLILSFLVLDLYLIVQFTQKQADLSVLEHTESTIEDQLEAEKIKIPNLANKKYKETFISVEPKLILNGDLKDLKKLEKQDSEVIQNKLIVSKIKDPIKAPVETSQETMNNLLENLVLFPEDYSFWELNEDMNVLIYFQQKLDRPIYYNQNGLLLLFLNDNNEITYYTQTVLGEQKQNKDTRNLISSMRAIETLYESDKFMSDDEVTTVEMGFHTRVPLESGVQVFAPTWKVEVNEEYHYFVNAIEEFIFSSEHQMFLKETLMNIREKAEFLKEKKVNKKEFLKELNEKINIIERSE